LAFFFFLLIIQLDRAAGVTADCLPLDVQQTEEHVGGMN
jgi:hypothetical protein